MLQHDSRYPHRRAAGLRATPLLSLGGALLLAFTLAPGSAQAVPPPPTPDVSGLPTQPLILHLDGTRLPDRLIGASVDFKLPGFVESVLATSVHPFAVQTRYERAFWSGRIVLAEDVLPGTRGMLGVVVRGLVDGKPIQVVQAVEIVAHAGPEEHTVTLGGRAAPQAPRGPFGPGPAAAAVRRLISPFSSVTLYPSVPNLDVRFGTGLVPTEIRSRDGVTVHRHITRELRPEEGMLPAVITMTFERDGEPLPVRIVSRVTQSDPSTPDSTVPTYHYLVTQTEGSQSWSYRIDLSYNENTGILESWIHAGTVSERGVYDGVSRTWVEPYPADLDHRLFFEAGAPLAGMDPGYLRQYQGDAADLLPANTDSVYATEVEIEGNVGELPGGTPTVAEDDGAPSGKHPNLACVAACFACGATLFMGPTCTQWVDCIDWAENPRQADPAEPTEH